MKLIFSFSFMLIFLLIFPASWSVDAARTSNVKTQTQTTTVSYQVKPHILIPRNIDRPSNIDALRSAIVASLSDISSFYGSKLGGHTFRFDGNVDEIQSNRDLNASLYSNTYDMYVYMVGVPSYRQGIVDVYWILGSGSVLERTYVFYAADGTTPLPGGYVLMNNTDLLKLASPSVADRNRTLGITAHELGHAFNLVLAGWAKDHPCTVDSPNECKDGASPPLPQSDEWLYDLMGYGLYNYPSASFNNTDYNPEIQKLFQSMFINPNQDPAPPTVPSIRGTLTIDSVFPNPLTQGQILEISGSDFGSAPGSVKIIRSGVTLSGFSIISWTDTLIRIQTQVNAVAQDLATNWTVTVTNADRSEEASTILTISATISAPTTTITIPFSVTCGLNQPFPQVLITLSSTPNLTGQLVGAYTDSNGIGTITYTITNAQPGQIFYGVPEAISDISPAQPTARTYTIPDPVPSNYNFTGTSFTYSQCPASLNADLQFTGLTISDTSIDEAVDISFVERNAGVVDAVAHTIGIYGDGQLLTSVPAPPLAAGEVRAASISDFWEPNTGTHTMEIRADINNQVRESNENNNRIIQSFTEAETAPPPTPTPLPTSSPTPTPSPQGLITSPYPDLVVTDISNKQATSGTPFQFTATIKNRNTACVSSHITGGGTFYAAATLAGNPLQIFPMSALACIANPTVGETYTTGVFGWTPLNVSSPTNYTVHVCADTGGGGIGINGNGTSSNVEELNEANNCNDFTITVSPRGTATLPPPPGISAPSVVNGVLIANTSCVAGKPQANLSWGLAEGFQGIINLGTMNYWNIFRTMPDGSQSRFNKISDTFLQRGVYPALDPAIYSGTLTSFVESGPTSAAVCATGGSVNDIVTCPNLPENTQVKYNVLGLVTNGYSTSISFVTNQVTLTTPNCSTATPTPTPIPMTATCQLVYNKLQSSVGSSCTSGPYDKIADINKDQSVNITDFSLFSTNTNGGVSEAACQTINNNTANPCVSSSPTPAPTVLGPGDCSVSLTANGADNTLNVPVGANVTFAWSTTGDIDNVLAASGAWSGNIPAPGSTSQSQGAAGTSTRTLTCIGSNGVSHSDSITVNVGGSFTPTPTSSPLPKQLVRITFDGTQIYPSIGTPARLDLTQKQVFDMVITYTDTSGLTQTITKSINFVRPTPSASSTPVPMTATCQLVYNKLQSSLNSSCGNANYDKIADLNKDRSVNIPDFSLFSTNTNGGANESVCQTMYNDPQNPCATPVPTPVPTSVPTPLPTPIPTAPTCQLLLNKISASLGSSCGSANFDPVADVTKDGLVNLSDFSYVSANYQNETLCQSKYNNTTNVCK